MTFKETQRLARQIERDDPRCHVTGTREYESGGYALDVTDTRTGIPFVINSPQDWNDRAESMEDQGNPVRGVRHRHLTILVTPEERRRYHTAAATIDRKLSVVVRDYLEEWSAEVLGS